MTTLPSAALHRMAWRLRDLPPAEVARSLLALGRDDQRVALCLLDRTTTRALLTHLLEELRR